MKLQFLGAAREVTGSQYYLRTDGAKVLVDCGMFQEREFLHRNWDACPVRPRDIDVVLLTHAHLDHCGLLPRLVQEGFCGPVMTTPASADLVDLVLRDSVQIQAEDVAFKKKRHRKEGRQGKYPEKPLYTMRDVERTLPLLKPVAYDRPQQINGDMSAVFRQAGHILGSAMIEIEVRNNGRRRKLVFSGDIGQVDKPLIRPPADFTQTDFLVMESTYGNRNHGNHRSIEEQLAEVISQTVAGGGKVIIPIFAIERAQELIYFLSRLLRAKRIPSIPVFLDSPMAAEVNEVFRRHRECLEPGMMQLPRFRRPRAGLPRADDRADRRGVEGDQRSEGAGGHHGHQRHVYGRTHQASFGAIHWAAGLHDSFRRLSGGRHAGAADSRRQPRGPRVGSFALGACEDRRDSGLFRPCRPRRLAGLALAFQQSAAGGLRHARRSGSIALAGQRASHDQGLERDRAGVPAGGGFGVKEKYQERMTPFPRI